MECQPTQPHSGPKDEGTLQQGFPKDSSVSVIIPCYNAAATVARTIQSVLSQASPPNEIIVVDDGSKDESIQAIQKFGERVILLKEQNNGACAARNRGLSHARSEFVMFLDADDEIGGDYLGAGAKIASTGGYDLLLTAMIMRTEERFLGVRDNIPDQPSNLHLFSDWLLVPQQVNPSAMLWRRSFLQKIGGWNEHVLVQQDGELALRAFLKDAAVGRNPHGYGIYYRQRPSSISTTRSAEKESNLLDTLEGLLIASKGTPFEHHTSGIEAALYWTTRTAFRNQQIEVGRKGISILKRHRRLKHLGSPVHRMVSGVLGLELKTRLWR